MRVNFYFQTDEQSPVFFNALISRSVVLLKKSGKGGNIDFFNAEIKDRKYKVGFFNIDLRNIDFFNIKLARLGCFNC